MISDSETLDNPSSEVLFVSRKMKRSHCLVASIFLALFVARLVLVGDTCFLGDEMNLVAKAARLNAEGRLASEGLHGSHALYGPFGIWVYQLLFLFSKNLLILATIKCVITLSFFSLSLWLVRPFLGSLNPFVYLVPFLSPFFWYYSKDLWDNSWTLPLSSLGLACYCRFILKEKFLFFFFSALLVTLSILTHLMSASIAAGIAVHALYFHRGWLRKHFLPVTAVVCLCAALAFPYAVAFFVDARPVAPEPTGFLSWFIFRMGHLTGGFVNPLLIPEIFSSIYFDFIAGPNWWFPPASAPLLVRILVPVAYLSTLFVFWPVWRGAYVYLKDGRRSENQKTRELGFLILFVIVFHCLMGFSQRLGAYPHYFNALWLVAFLFLAGGVKELWTRRFFPQAFAGYVVGLGMILIYWISLVHLNEGTRSLHFGPTLVSLIRISKEASRYSVQIPIGTEDEMLRKTAIGVLPVLRGLVDEKEIPEKVARLSLRFVNPEDPFDARVVLVAE